MSPGPKNVAVGIRYDDGRVPTVIRKGLYDRTSEVLREARRYGIPVVEDRQLASRLGEIQLLESVPEECFEALAAELIRLRLVT
jgi:flagellar biosynthesis protein